MKAKHLIDLIKRDSVVKLQRYSESSGKLTEAEFGTCVVVDNGGVLVVRLEEYHSDWWREGSFAYFHPTVNVDESGGIYTSKSWHGGGYNKLETLWHITFNASRDKVLRLLNQ